MPVEVSIVCTLIVQLLYKSLTGPACYGFSCRIGERERDMFATQKQKLTIRHVCRGVNSVNTSYFSRYTNHSQGLLAADADSSVVLEREIGKNMFATQK